MQAPPLTEEERDEALEADLPHDSEGRQEVFRPKMEDIAQAWVTALMLYSGLLRDMELIPDEVKRRHLANVMQGWGIFTAQGLWVVPLLAKHRKMKVNGVEYEVALPRHYSEARVARTIYLELLNSISYLIKTKLGTEKLEHQLTEPKFEEAREPAILKYYRYSLIADLRIGDWCGALNSLHDHLRSIPYLRESLLRKIGGMYSLGFDLRDGEGKLRQMAGKMLGELRGRSHSDSKRQAVRSVEDLKKRALVRRLRLNADNRS